MPFYKLNSAICYYFCRSSDRKYSRYVRRPRQNLARERTDDLQFSDDADYVASSSNRRSSNSGGDRRDSRSSASEQVPIRLAFPGNDYKTSRRTERDSFSGRGLKHHLLFFSFEPSNRYLN